MATCRLCLGSFTQNRRNDNFFLRAGIASLSADSPLSSLLTQGEKTLPAGPEHMGSVGAVCWGGGAELWGRGERA